MSIKFTKKVAGELLGRGENALTFKPTSMEEIKKAITRDDVRKLVKDGAIFAQKPRSELHKKRVKEGRKRGAGKRKGSAKARQGRKWEKKVRSQRILLKRLKLMGKVDNTTFKRYYLLVKGNAFPDKRSLLLHLSDDGIKVSDEEIKQVNEYVKSTYR
jgi:large subunit ribosomal protein L19e